MSRKSQIVVVPQEWGGRDAGTHYLLTEMPAAQAEWWGVRMMLLLKGTSGEISETMAGRGMEAVAIAGLNAILSSPINPAELKPLWDEMMTCVKKVRDPSAIGPDGRPIASELVGQDDINEIRTLLWLRSEVVRLHINFSPADAMSALLSLMKPDTTQAA